MKRLLKVISKLPLAGTSITRSFIIEVLASKTSAERIKNLRKTTCFLIIMMVGHAGQIFYGVKAISMAHQIVIQPIYDAETFRFVATEQWLLPNLIVGIPYVVLNALTALVEVYLLHRIWQFHACHRNQYPRFDVHKLAARLPGVVSLPWLLFSCVFTLAPQIAIAMMLG